MSDTTRTTAARAALQCLVALMGAGVTLASAQVEPGASRPAAKDARSDASLDAIADRLREAGVTGLDDVNTVSRARADAPLAASFGDVLSLLHTDPAFEARLLKAKSPLSWYLGPVRGGRAVHDLIGTEDSEVQRGASWRAFVGDSLRLRQPGIARAAYSAMTDRKLSSPSPTWDMFVALVRADMQAVAEELEAEELLKRRVRALESLESWLKDHESKIAPPVAAHGWAALADQRSGIVQLEDGLRPAWIDSDEQVARAEEQVERWYRHACKLAPGSVEATTQLVGWLMNHGDESDLELVEMLDGALKVAPAHGQALLLRAGLDLCRAREADARDGINKAIGAGGVSPDVAIERVARSVVGRAGAEATKNLLGQAARAADSPDMWFLYADHRIRMARGMLGSALSPYAYQRAPELPKLVLFEDDAEELTAAFERAASSAKLGISRTARLTAAALRLHSGDLPGAVQAFDALLAETPGSVEDWYAVNEIIQCTVGLEPQEKMLVLDALTGGHEDGTAAGPHWPALCVLAWECGRRRDIDRAADLFAAACDAARSEEGDLSFVTGLWQRLSSQGFLRANEYGPARDRMLARADDTTAGEIRKAFDVAAGARFQAFESRSRSAWAPPSRFGGYSRPGVSFGRSYDVSTEISLELMEYCDSLSNSPMGNGGVPMVRYVTPGGNIMSHTVGQGYLNW